MAGRKRPTQQDARERLQAAQEREAAALAAVEVASGKVARAKDKLAAVLVARQRQVQEAEQRLVRARAALAQISGVERAATLLDDAVARVRADVRAAQTHPQPGKGIDERTSTADRHPPAAAMGGTGT